MSKADVRPLDEDLKQLRNGRFSAQDVWDIGHWVFVSVLKEPELAVDKERLDLLGMLKDGTILCRLANALSQPDAPTSRIKYKPSKMPFQQMDLIAQFLQFARSYGVPEDELFQTVDLYEAKDPAIVYQTIKSLSRYANKKHPELFPVIGPQLATKRHRPPVTKKPTHLQGGHGWSTSEYGYMKGASQKTEGISFGKRRDVV